MINMQSGNNNFPSLLTMLWDRTPSGSSVHMQPQPSQFSISFNKNILTTLNNNFQDLSSQKTCILNGRIVAIANNNSCCDLSKISLLIDDINSDISERESPKYNHKFIVPLYFSNKKELYFSRRHYSKFVTTFLKSCGSGIGGVNLSNYITCSCLILQHKTDKSLKLYGEFIFPSHILKFTPLLSPLKFSNESTLTKELCNFSLKCDSFQTGFLTLDKSSLLLPLYDNYPSSYEHPLVGIWVYDAKCLDDLLVWASCLRFVYSEAIVDRVGVEALTFLVLFCDKYCRDITLYECQIAMKSPILEHLMFEGHMVLPHEKPDNIWYSFQPIKVTSGRSQRYFYQSQGLNYNPTPISRSTLTQSPDNLWSTKSINSTQTSSSPVNQSVNASKNISLEQSQLDFPSLTSTPSPTWQPREQFLENPSTKKTTILETQVLGDRITVSPFTVQMTKYIEMSHKSNINYYNNASQLDVESNPRDDIEKNDKSNEIKLVEDYTMTEFPSSSSIGINTSFFSTFPEKNTLGTNTSIIQCDVCDVSTETSLIYPFTCDLTTSSLSTNLINAQPIKDDEYDDIDNKDDIDYMDSNSDSENDLQLENISYINNISTWAIPRIDSDLDTL